MPLTTIYQLKTFADIVSAILEELKIQSTDTTATQRIKRDINIVYLDDVIPFAQWKWLRGTLDATVYAAISAGTASVTQGSNVVTLTTAIVSPKEGWLFGVVGYNEVYRIASHDASSVTLRLQVPYTGTTSTTAAYKVWTDEIYLPSFVRDTFEISHDFMDEPLESCGLQKYRQIVAALPRAEGRPLYYTTNTYVDPIGYALPTGLPAISSRSSNTINKTLTFASDVSNYLQQGDRIKVSSCSEASYNGEWVIASQSGASITYTASVPIYETTATESAAVIKKAQPSSDTRRAKRVQVYPAVYTQNTTLHIDHIREVTPLADTTDEPLMPIGDRTVLLYGALQRAWSRERNPEEAKRNLDLFNAKLDRMAGKLDDSIDQPKLIPSRVYLSSKRMAQRQRDTRSGIPEGWGGGSAGGQVITNTANRAAIFDSTGALGASVVLANSELVKLSGIGSQAVGTSDTNTLTNKTLLDTTNVFAYVADSTRKMAVSLSGATTLTTATLAFIQTANRAYTFPDVTDTMVTLTSTGTLTNKTVLDGSTVVANTTVTTKTFVWDLSGATASSRATLAFTHSTNRTYTVPDATDVFVLNNVPASLQDKLFADAASTSKRLTFNMSGLTAATSAQFAFTSSANSIFTFPKGSDTLTGRSSTDTLTNKTFSTASNTLQSGAALSGQVLTADGASGTSWATPTSAPDSSNEIFNLGLACSVASSALTISLVDKSGNTPTGGSFCQIGFRNSQASTGQYSVGTVTSARNMVLALNSTLGTSGGKVYYPYVYALLNSTAVELATSLSDFDEGTLQTTVAEGGGSSTSQAVLYSSTARSSVPIRQVGRLKINQLKGGSWTALPTEISLKPFQRIAVGLRVARSATQGVSASTQTNILYETINLDTHNGYVLATGEWVCMKAGLYVFHAATEFDVSNVGQRAQSLAVNATIVAEIGQEPSPSAANTARVSGSTQYPLVVGDRVTMQAFQSTVGSLNIGVSGIQFTHFSIQFVDDRY